MKFQREATGEFAIAAYTAESVTIGAVNHAWNIATAWRCPHARLAGAIRYARSADIAADAIAQCRADAGPIVLIGTTAARCAFRPRRAAIFDPGQHRLRSDGHQRRLPHNVRRSAKGVEVAALLLFER